MNGKQPLQTIEQRQLNIIKSHKLQTPALKLTPSNEDI